jgi:hypothetical protein
LQSKALEQPVVGACYFRVDLYRQIVSKTKFPFRETFLVMLDYPVVQVSKQWNWRDALFSKNLSGEAVLRICAFGFLCPIFPIGGLTVNVGRTLFSQVMDFVPWTSFDRIVECLRDIEACLGAQPSKLYGMGLREAVARSTLADDADVEPTRPDPHGGIILRGIRQAKPEALARQLLADERPSDDRPCRLRLVPEGLDGLVPGGSSPG